MQLPRRSGSDRESPASLFSIHRQHGTPHLLYGGGGIVRNEKAHPWAKHGFDLCFSPGRIAEDLAQGTSGIGRAECCHDGAVPAFLRIQVRLRGTLCAPDRQALIVQNLPAWDRASGQRYDEGHARVSRCHHGGNGAPFTVTDEAYAAGLNLWPRLEILEGGFGVPGEIAGQLLRRSRPGNHPRPGRHRAERRCPYG